MNRDQIERAEAVMAKLKGIERRIVVAEEARGWKRPKSLAQAKTRREYQFTEEQLLIAARSLARKG